ncbi:MAG: glycosyltransferase family 9 protein [Simkania sp.]|nr:glycosyltransferase family 9 protein [Simkania sp.]
MTVKILIVKTSALGDIVQALPLLSYLRARCPEATIDWVVEKGGADLVKACPLIDRTLVVDTKYWRKNLWISRKDIITFIKRLRERHYDVLFDLQGNTKSALLTYFSRATCKVGFGYKSVPEFPNLFVTHRRFNPKGDENMVQRYLSVIQQFYQDKTPWVQTPLLLHTDKTLPQLKQTAGFCFMVCFGSRWENKKLSTEVWKEFLFRVAKEDRLWIVYGNEEEKKEAERLIEHLQGKATLLSPMSLPVWQNMMGRMDGVIAVDSVGLHLGGLAGVATLSFFGPSLATVYQPSGKQHSSIQGKCPYGFEFDRRCPRLRTCTSGACLKQMHAEDLWGHFQEWRSRCQNRCVSRQDQQLP